MAISNWNDLKHNVNYATKSHCFANETMQALNAYIANHPEKCKSDDMLLLIKVAMKAHRSAVYTLDLVKKSIEKLE